MKARVVYSTNMDILYALQNSNVIYQFSNHYNSCYAGCTSQTLQDRIKQQVSKSILSCSSLPETHSFCSFFPNFPHHLIPIRWLRIQQLDYIFYKILPVNNIMMTVDFVFLPKNAVLSVYLLLKPLSSKLLTPPSADKVNSCTA